MATPAKDSVASSLEDLPEELPTFTLFGSTPSTESTSNEAGVVDAAAHTRNSTADLLAGLSEPVDATASPARAEEVPPSFVIPVEPRVREGVEEDEEQEDSAVLAKEADSLVDVEAPPSSRDSLDLDQLVADLQTAQEEFASLGLSTSAAPMEEIRSPFAQTPLMRLQTTQAHFESCLEAELDDLQQVQCEEFEDEEADYSALVEDDDDVLDLAAVQLPHSSPVVHVSKPMVASPVNATVAVASDKVPTDAPELAANEAASALVNDEHAQKQVENLENELEQLQSQATIDRTKMESLQRELEQAQSQALVDGETIEGLRHELAVSKKESVELEEELFEILEELDELQEEKSLKIVDLEQQVDLLQQQLDSVRQSEEQQLDAVDGLRRELEGQRTANATLAEEHQAEIQSLREKHGHEQEALRAQLKDVSNQLSELQRGLEFQRTAHATLTEEHQAEIHALREKHGHEQEALRAELKNVSNRLSERQLELESQRTANVTLTEEHQAEIRSLREKHGCEEKMLRTELKEVSNRLSELQKESTKSLQAATLGSRSMGKTSGKATDDQPSTPGPSKLAGQEQVAVAATPPTELKTPMPKRFVDSRAPVTTSRLPAPLSQTASKQGASSRRQSTSTIAMKASLHQRSPAVTNARRRVTNTASSKLPAKVAASGIKRPSKLQSGSTMGSSIPKSSVKKPTSRGFLGATASSSLKYGGSATKSKVASSGIRKPNRVAALQQSSSRIEKGLPVPTSRRASALPGSRIARSSGVPAKTSRQIPTISIDKSAVDLDTEPTLVSPKDLVRNVIDSMSGGKESTGEEHNSSSVKQGKQQSASEYPDSLDGKFESLFDVWSTAKKKPVSTKSNFTSPSSHLSQLSGASLWSSVKPTPMQKPRTPNPSVYETPCPTEIAMMVTLLSPEELIVSPPPPGISSESCKKPQSTVEENDSAAANRLQAQQDLEWKASVSIQSVARVLIARRQLDELASAKQERDCSEHHAAVMVQQSVRSYLAKSIFMKLVAERNLHLEARESASTKIQQSFRRHVVYRKEQEVKKSSSITIQKQIRSFLARQHLRMLRNCRLEIEVKSAVLLQSFARGTASRIRTSEMLKKKELELIEASAAVLQSIVRSYLAKLELEKRVASKEMRKSNSVIQIQTFTRVYLARRQLKHLKRARRFLESDSAMSIQALTRMHLARLELKDLQKRQLLQKQIGAATRIQIVMRMHLAVSKLKELKLQQHQRKTASAASIQALARMVLAMGELRRLRQQRIRQVAAKNAASITIQSLARIFLARVELGDRKHRREVFSATFIQSIWRMYLAQAERARLVEHQLALKVSASTRIQSFVRMIFAHSELNRLKDQELSEFAATEIQSVARMYLARGALKELKDAEMKIHTSAAILIQSVTRMHLACALLTDLQERQRLREESATTSMQSLVRTFLAQRKLIELKKYHEQRRIECATVIQAYGRRMLCRLLFWSLKEKLNDLREAKLAAACVIQDLARTFLDRRALARLSESRSNAATRVQCAVRMWIARTKFVTYQRSSIEIQTFYRMCHGITVKNQLMKMRLEAASRIQAVSRGHVARRTCAKLREEADAARLKEEAEAARLKEEAEAARLKEKEEADAAAKQATRGRATKKTVAGPKPTPGSSFVLAFDDDEDDGLTKKSDGIQDADASGLTARTPLQSMRPAQNVVSTRTRQRKLANPATIDNAQDNDRATSPMKSVKPAESMKVVELKDELLALGCSKAELRNVRKAQLIEMLTVQRGNVQA